VVRKDFLEEIEAFKGAMNCRGCISENSGPFAENSGFPE
jgi:hypothetical protein